jgi:hypothetical protein
MQRLSQCVPVDVLEALEVCVKHTAYILMMCRARQATVKTVQSTLGQSRAWSTGQAGAVPCLQLPGCQMTDVHQPAVDAWC